MTTIDRVLLAQQLEEVIRRHLACNPMTPFHNMALISPYTSEADIDRHTDVFREAVISLSGRGETNES